MREAEQLARMLKALATEARVEIILLLQEKALCVNALASRLRMTSAAVSQHLRILRDAGLVIPDKRGYYVHYSLNRKTLNQWRGLVSDLLAADES